MRPTLRLLAVVSALAASLTAPLALSQEAPTTRPAGAGGEIDPDAPNLVHGRHLHPRTEKLPTTRNAARFVTNRPGAIQLPLPEEKDAFTFVVFGDRTGGPAEGINVLADAVRDTNLLAPDLVFTVGDLIQGYNETPEWMTQMKEYKAVMDRLVSPWFPVAGNHDVYWRDKDRSGDPKPEGEHEKNYETHFGPLWYAVHHKNAWFIALYSDEGNPVTGEKNFRSPEANVMSEAQLSWLKETLAKAKGADHVFLFLHHPRWLGQSGGHGGSYGDSWAPVHKALVEAGNVTAVFGGHIHQMRSDPRDGIEYVTLATVGGGQSGTVPSTGSLHQYHVITVRKDQVAMTAYPVGAAMDVREITGDLVAQSQALARADVTIDTPVKFAADGSVSATISVKVSNPTSRPVEFTVMPDSKDSRWAVRPDHNHKVVNAGADHEFRFRVRRAPSAFDETVRLLDVVVDADLLGDSKRYPIPTRILPVPTDVATIPAAGETALNLADDGAALAIPASQIKLPGNTFTLESRFRARSFKPRNGLLCRTQNANYGIFVSNARPQSSVFLGDSYLQARAPEDLRLEAGRWHHIASVFDGTEIRLYVDGKLIARNRREGQTLRENDLPLIIGGDVTGNGTPTDTLDGEFDWVRLSSSVRYTGESYDVGAQPARDADTLLLLTMDRRIGDRLVEDASGRILPLPAGVELVPLAK